MDSLESVLFDDCLELQEDFHKFLKLLGDFEEIDGFDPTPLAMSLCAVHSGKRDVAAKVEPAVKKWLESHYKQGLMDLGDADALRALAFQALQHRAPELTANQAEVVLRFAFFARCSVDVIRAIVRPGTVNGDCTRDVEQGVPLLVFAAERGDLELVNILLDAGADDQRLSAFNFALLEKHHHIVDRFLDHFHRRGDTPIRALNLAIQHGTLDLIKRLLERIPVSHLSARLGGPAVVSSSWTVLFTAASIGKIEIVKLLIESGIDVLARDSKGRTASAVCEKLRKDVLEYLEQEEDKARLESGLKGIYSQTPSPSVYGADAKELNRITEVSKMTRNLALLLS